jgi:hypothetical protein
MEKLVVSIAANQGLIALQNARLIHERDSQFLSINLKFGVTA